jgi:mannose-6-phosphate isomerase-like protein (cupin superfamily)
MRIAMLSPRARQNPAHRSDRRDRLVHALTEGLRSRHVDVTVFSTADAEMPGRYPTCQDEPESQTGLASEVRESVNLGEFFERSHEYDLIHNHAGYLPLTYSCLVNKPFLTTLHGLPSPDIMPAYRKFNDRSYYVSLSDTVRAPELGYLKTVYPGVDVKAFTFRSEPDGFLVYTGPIAPDQGIRKAIEIARLADTQLVIAGEVENEAYFETELKPRLDTRTVRHLDPTYPQGYGDILSRARALLKTTCWNDRFPIEVIDASACGTPVIAFPIGPLPELIVDGVNGYVVSDTSEAVEVIHHLSDLPREQCRRTAEERFSQDRMVDEYLHVYEGILEQAMGEDRRPWGYYVVLSDSDDHKVKRIVVYPGKRLSLQRHRRRAEHWTVISGSPVVTRGQEQIRLMPGESIDIPLGAMHRVFNPGHEPVVFIEVQMGDYFGEDDIERFEDDFGRV